MKVVIATTQVPFVNGGAEYLTESLKTALELSGHRTDIVKMPFKWYPPERIPEHILASRLFDLTESCGTKIDLLIGLKFPAYYFRHPNKVLWILHQHKQAYELLQTEHSDLHQTPTGLNIREIVRKADNLYLKEARKIFTISKNVSSRLNHFNKISSIPLYPPCTSSEQFYCETYGDFILFPSRMEPMKRQHLAIEAMQYVKTPLKLFLVGHADTLAYMEMLRKRVQRLRLEEKVKFLPYVSEEEKRSLYSRCRAVLFPTFDEDYGYVIPEAFYSSKAVITCTDSGAPLEFVEDLKTGMICESTPSKIAEAIDALEDSKNLAQVMGENARKKILTMNFSWDNTIKELTII